MSYLHKGCGGMLRFKERASYGFGMFEADVFICDSCNRELEEANDYDEMEPIIDLGTFRNPCSNGDDTVMVRFGIPDQRAKVRPVTACAGARVGIIDCTTLPNLHLHTKLFS